MTGGVLAMAVLVAFVVWILRRIWETRKNSRWPRRFPRAPARHGGCLLGASLTDYQLRTPIAGAILVFRLLADRQAPVRQEAMRARRTSPDPRDRGGRR